MSSDMRSVPETSWSNNNNHHHSSSCIESWTFWSQCCQLSSWQSSATPRAIQCDCGRSLGISIAMTKLVEWPVVERTPRLSLVLYTGAVYVCFSGRSERRHGFIHIWGAQTR